ncbi:hypothetical protein ACFQH5_19220 [Halomonas salifodinae]|uniref:Uncharacterized protein n=1 Tax=Halomonas salifodinae TaxID=438745 RepID=A0ABW2F3Q5_9GAMM
MSSEININERIEAIEVGVSIALTAIVDQLVSGGKLSPIGIGKAVESQLKTQREVQSDYPEYQALYDSHNYFLEQISFHCKELIQHRDPDPSSPPSKGRPSWFIGIYTNEK